MKKLVTIFLLLFLSLVLAAGSILLFTQTVLFKNWLRDFIVNQSGNYLNGTLQIGSIGGNLFSHLQLSQILLSSDQDTIIYLPAISLDLLPTRLLSKEIHISAVHIDSLYVHLQQFEDGSWNIGRMLPGDTTQSADTSKPRKPLGWTLNLQTLQMSEGRLAISLPDSQSVIPRQVRNIHLRFNGHYDDSRQSLHLQELRFNLARPAFSLEQLSFDLTIRENKLRLDSLLLQTSRNRIDAAGVYYPADTNESTVQLATSPFDIADLHLFIPALQINGHPSIAFNAVERSDSIMFMLDVSEGEQNLQLSGMVEGLRAGMNDPARLPSYQVTGMIQQLDAAAYWSADSTVRSLLNGRFRLSGRGITPREAALTLEAELEDSRLWDRELTRARLNIAYQRDTLQGKLEAQSDIGTMTLDGQVRDIFATPQFDLRAKLHKVNLGPLLPGDSLQTALNLDLAGSGTHFTPERLNASLAVNLAPSEVGDIHLDTLFCLLAIRNETLHIDTLYLDSQPLLLKAAGTLDMEASGDLRFDTRLKETAALWSLVATDTLNASGKISGRIQGTVDSLGADIDYQLSGLQYQKAVSIDSLGGRLSFFRKPGDLKISANAVLDSIIAGGIFFHGLELTSQFSNQRLSLDFDFFEKDSLRFQTEMIVNRDSLLQITIPALNLEFLENRWSGGSDSMRVVISDDHYEFQNVRFTSPLPDSLVQPGSLPEQAITLEGNLSQSGSEDVALRIVGLNIQEVSKFFDTHLRLEGLLSLQFSINGSADNPLLTASAAVRNGQINRFSYQNFEGNLEYNSERLDWDLSLQGRENIRMAAEGILPLNLAFTNRGEVLYRDREFEVRVSTEHLTLQTMESFSNLVKEARGDVTLTLNIANTIDNPRMDGSLQLSNGTLKIPRYGIDYGDIQLKLAANNSALSLEAFKVGSAMGMLTASGETTFEGGIFGGKLSSTRVDIVADKFLVAKNQDLELQIDGKIGLGSDIDTPQLNGDVEILRSRLYLPAFYTDIENTTQTDESLPMLVAATAKAAPGDTLAKTPPGNPSKKKARRSGGDSTSTSLKPEKSPGIFSNYYHNLNGKITLDIPRNTWLVTKDLKVELSGTLDFIKNGPDFELFGTIQTLRGEYNLLGRRLKIEEGRFTFQGGKEFNPLIHITAVYEFKGNDRQSNKLEIEISDKVRTPTFTFTLNDQEISEGDALSYIVFGYGMNELSQGQKSGLADGGSPGSGDFVANYFASKMANQVTRNLGKSLEMDLLELKGQENWKEVSFVVGKYLTNELFISYEKRFGLSQSSNVNKDIITLEWELFHFLILQLVGGDETVSGIDAILRFER